MPKYEGKQNFLINPNVGKKQWGEEERIRTKKEEEKNQWKQWPAPLSSATKGGAPKPPGPKWHINLGGRVG